jgi:hypothetical protein
MNNVTAGVLLRRNVPEAVGHMSICECSESDARGAGRMLRLRQALQLGHYL